MSCLRVAYSWGEPSPAILFLFIGVLLSACDPPDQANMIKGHGLDIPDQTIYLIDAHTTEMLDSTMIKGGDFVFRIRDSFDRPLIFSIRYYDNYKKTNDLLGFPDNTEQGFYTAFLLEKGTTLISPYQRKDDSDFRLGHYGMIKEGTENDLYRRFLFLRLSSSSDHQKRIKDYASVIKKHPDSRFAAYSLYINRFSFDTKDLEALFNLFSESVRVSYQGTLLQQYMVDVSDPSGSTFIDPAGQVVPDIEHRHSLNMLVFWAAWCKPCMEEIPQIRTLHERYAQRKEVGISSISMDKDSAVWKKTMSLFELTWPQYLIPKDQLEMVTNKYQINGIPLVVFTDRQGRVVKRFQGYSKKNIELYMAYIDEFLDGLR